MKNPDVRQVARYGIDICAEFGSSAFRPYSEKALSRFLQRNQASHIIAAHIIGSYMMNTEEFAERAVRAEVIPPLVELLRGRLTWVDL